VLLLGDSFANIFSLEALGWGESGRAGRALERGARRALDRLRCCGTSDAAFASREMLDERSSRAGEIGSPGRRSVIWAIRGARAGVWELEAVEMKLGTPVPSRFFTPTAGEEVAVSGTVEAIGAVPRPGSVPYADHVTAVHLTDVTVPHLREEEPRQAVVYMLSMRDNVWTPAARLRAGERVTLRVKAWTDVAPQYEQINRSEIDDPELQLEEPAWGELVQ
jgi:alginate O-acetyltransferase complex protein AlgJ